MTRGYFSHPKRPPRDLREPELDPGRCNLARRGTCRDLAGPLVDAKGYLFRKTLPN
ncbi:hypothetical protein [Labilibaculum antarcticum]|uniref:hypothetical protein n=1 Tax=Labilibaculum antarcticum TaxID=1717717 RepID=UPI0012931FE8|nr:hypothetical protein [Labilibaculum antarcticum]